MPRKRVKTAKQPERRREPGSERSRPLSPLELDWCDPDYDLEVDPEPGDFDFERDWDDD